MESKVTIQGIGIPETEGLESPKKKLVCLPTCGVQGLSPCTLYSASSGIRRGVKEIRRR